MGEPVKIIDLARRMIELSGHEPGVDIAIEVVGIRPGEKLHEELFNVDEEVKPTRYGKIMRATRPAIDPERLRDSMDELDRLVADGRPGAGGVGAVGRPARRKGRGPRRRRPGGTSLHKPWGASMSVITRTETERELPVGALPVAEWGLLSRVGGPAPTTAASAPASPATPTPVASCSGASPGSTTSATARPPAPAPDGAHEAPGSAA